ncbi:MAG: diaminopimelate epimerase [Acidimicrobiia bacterium]
MRLTKHHGLGNDFLVLLDLDGAQAVTGDDAVALCHRHTGIGADGLLVAGPPVGQVELSMVLYNADGSRAEMSGNGIRCLVQAALHAGVVDGPEVRVATDAGVRTVTVVDRKGRFTHRLSVDMGPAKVGEERPAWEGHGVVRSLEVDLGNPHVVLLWGEPELPARDELIAIGSRIDAATPGGANVEIVREAADGAFLDMVVFERGVGPTLACGTGACATAVAAHRWGLAGRRAVVHMPGGSVEVVVDDPVLLIGDATSVAAVDVPWPDEGR